MKTIFVTLMAAWCAAAGAQDLVPYHAQHWGFSDPSGKLVIPARYDFAEPFSEGLALVRSGVAYGFIDRTGKKIIPPKYQSAGSFSEGCAPVKTRGLWGCVDKAGKPVVPFEYEELLPFREGAAPAKKGGRWGLLLKDTREVRGGIHLLDRQVGLGTRDSIGHSGSLVTRARPRPGTMV